MLRVSKLLMKAPEAFQAGRSGAGPTKKTNPTAIPGGSASTPKSSPSSAPKTPSSGERNSDNGGMTYGTKTGDNGPSEPTPVVTTRSWEWETTVWSDNDPGEALDRILQA
jgi:hypothetical protein